MSIPKVSIEYLKLDKDTGVCNPIITSEANLGVRTILTQ